MKVKFLPLKLYSFLFYCKCFIWPPGKVFANKHESEYEMVFDRMSTISFFKIHSLRFLHNVIPEVEATYRVLGKAW